MSAALLGADLGGSGSRVALRRDRDAPREVLAGRPLAHGARGGDAAELVEQLLDDAIVAWGLDADPPAAVALGIAGLASVVADPASLRRRVRARLGPVPVALVADGVTAHLGALEGRPGAIVAAGTGVIGIGLSGDGEWRRVDGWGALLGDEGGGADLGRRGLRAALRAHDGRGEPTALLGRAIHRLGPPEDWPRLVAAPDDRAARLAAIAPEVGAAAEDGDPVAQRLIAEAGWSLARTAVAALGPAESDGAGDLFAPRRVAHTGGLFRIAPLRQAFLDAATALGVEAAPPAGDPLDGALRLAADLAGAGVIPLPSPPMSA